MKEITLKVSDETFEEIKKQLLYAGSTTKLNLNIIEAMFRESPKVEIEYVKGVLM